MFLNRKIENTTALKISRGTYFSPIGPLKYAEHNCIVTHKDYDEIIFYFLTDGDYGCPQSTIDSIKNRDFVSKVNFVAVGYGTA